MHIYIYILQITARSACAYTPAQQCSKGGCSCSWKLMEKPNLVLQCRVWRQHGREGWAEHHNLGQTQITNCYLASSSSSLDPGELLNKKNLPPPLCPTSFSSGNCWVKGSTKLMVSFGRGRGAGAEFRSPSALGSYSGLKIPQGLARCHHTLKRWYSAGN